MKHLFSSALLALMTFPVLANFVGLEYDVVAESEFGTTYRVYAKFDNTTDEVVAVYALETAPMNVAVSTTFYQAPVGGAFAQGINPLFFSAFPELQYDSWFTIGSADANGTSDVQQVGMDAYLNSFENGGGFYIDTFIGGSWFVLPNQSADAEADENGRVLVAQLTTDGVVNLTLNFQWDDETTATFNDEGVTLSFPTVAVLGCTNPNADNYDVNATEDDGSCTFGGGLCTGLSYELVASDPIGSGQSTYRVYANFTDPNVEVTAMYGTDTEPWELIGSEPFFQDALGGDFGGGINPLFFAAFPTLEYDTWWTIGAEPGDADGLNSAFDQALTSFADWNNGGDFLVNTFIGGSVFVVPGANAQGVPVNGRVLLAQVTTSGETSALINLQFRDALQFSHYAVGMTLTFPVAGAGCNDPLACNYDETAEGDADCVYAQTYYDCDGCINDTDGDGVCDELEVSGCTDSASCNYNPAATEEDGSCASLDVCGVCGGDGGECGGCTNPNADNFDEAALVDDGSCTFGGGLCTGLSYDLVASDPLGSGQSTYRVYANFTDPNVEVTAMYGTDTEPWELIGSEPFFQDALGGDFGGGINPLFFASFPTLEYDTWWTIGAEPGDSDGLNSAFDQALTSFADWNNGGDFIVNTFIGGSVFVVPGANAQGVPVNGRVLLAQVTTSGETSALINLQFRDALQFSHYAVGMTLTFPVAGAGCNDPLACNYDETAEGDADCVYAQTYYDCDGCINDADGDGVCDELEVSGCTDDGACNFDINATEDDGSCLTLDGCGVCGGDNSTCTGCTNADADNYDPNAIFDDGSCIVSGCTNADADNYNPEANNDDGSCIVSGCTNADADNYNPEANNDDGSCIISGCTNSDADNYNPDANNDDGSCIISGCTNPSAPNFDPNANNDDGSCLLTGCTYAGADNYDPANTVEDGSCIMSGCTDSTAENYIAYANNDDGSCVYEPCGTGSACPYDSNDDGEIGSADLLAFLVAYGQACADLGN